MRFPLQIVEVMGFNLLRCFYREISAPTSHLSNSVLLKIIRYFNIMPASFWQVLGAALQKLCGSSRGYQVGGAIASAESSLESLKLAVIVVASYCLRKVTPTNRCSYCLSYGK